MNIVHISPNAPYNDSWGYQENILPKYQKKLGHNVTLIITNTTHEKGKIVETDCTDYVSTDGVRIIRLRRKNYYIDCLTLHCSYLPVYSYLLELSPDMVFYHGLVSTTIYDVVKYKKNIKSSCIIVQDNHLDKNIGWGKKNLTYYINREFYRGIYRKTKEYISKVYGVTPWRKEYAEEFFDVSKEKTDVLIMGADDEKIDFEHRKEIRNRIRKKYQIQENEFLIVTGGKIDKKKKIDILMDAVTGINNVKLLIFGNVLDDVQKIFEEKLKKNRNIIYIGWINADSVYNYFFAADIAFFPGQHSVLWEQACAAKIPCVFEEWEGMHHVNNGGNSDFVTPINVNTLMKKINELNYTDTYYKMKQVAESEKTQIYLYSNVAKKSLECLYDKNE